MPYLGAGDFEHTGTGDGEITVPLGPLAAATVPAGRLVLIHLFSASRTNGQLTQKSGTTGWNVYVESHDGPGGSDSPTSAVFWKLIGNSEPDPTFEDSGGWWRFGGRAYFYDGVDAADPIGPDVTTISGYRAANTLSPVSSGGGTTEVANTLIAVCLGTRDDHNAAVAIDGIEESEWDHNSNDVCMGLYHALLTASGTTIPTFEFSSSSNAGQYHGITVPIRHASGRSQGIVDHASPPLSYLNPNFSGGSVSNKFVKAATSGAESDPTSLVTMLDGTATTYKQIQDGSWPFSPESHAEYPIFCRIFTNSAGDSNKPLLTQISLATSQDLTGKHLAIPVAADDVGLEALASGGLYVGLASGDGTAARVWKVGAGDTALVPGSTTFLAQIDVSQPGFVGDFGSGGFDITDVTHCLLGQFLRLYSTQSTYFGSFLLAAPDSPAILKGGTTTDPATPIDVYRYFDKTFQSRGFLRQDGQSDSLFFSAFSVQMGHATEEAYVDTAGTAIGLPGAYDAAGRVVHNNIPAGSRRYVVSGKAGSTVKVRSCFVDMGDRHRFMFDASASTSCNYDLSALFVVRAGTIALGDLGYPIAGMSFSDFELLEPGDADLSGGNSWDACIGTHAVEVDSQAKLSALANNTFTNSVDAAILISGDQAGTLNAPGGMSLDSSNATAVRYSGATDFTLSVPASTTGITSLTIENTGAGTMTVQAAATLTLQGTVAGMKYRATKVTGGALLEEGTAAGTTVTINTTDIGNTEQFDVEFSRTDGQYGRDTQRGTVSSSAGTVTANVTAGLGRTVSDTVALAYTGLTFNGTVVTDTGTHTFQQLVDWALANANANLDQVVPLSTADGGTSWQLATGVSIDVQGSVTTTTKTVAGGNGVGVSSGGFFEAKDGALWDDGGTLRYLKHNWVKVVKLSDAGALRYGALAVWSATAGRNMIWTTGLSNVPVESDSSGLAEFYIEYRTDATVHSDLGRYCYRYEYQSQDNIPVAADGAQVGTAASREFLRLQADANVTLTRTAALAITGITTTHATRKLDTNSDSYSDVNDNVKARQASIADIETGKPGIISYIENGDLFAFNGSAYVIASAWAVQNAADTTSVLTGGTVELGTAGTISLKLGAITIDYLATGTFDHRAATISGTLTLKTTNASTVTVQVTPDETTVNTANPANITVQATLSFAFTIPALPDNTDVAVYNDDQSTVLGRYLTSGGTGLSVNYTYGAGQEVAPGDDLSWKACVRPASASTHYLLMVGAAPASGGPMGFTVTPELWPDMNTIGTLAGAEGSTINEFTLGAGGLNMNADDADGLTEKKRIVLRWYYYLRTAAGMDGLWEAFTVLASNNVRFNDTKANVKIANVGTTQITFTDDDFRLWRESGGSPYAPGNSIFMDYEGVPQVVTISLGSNAVAITQTDLDQLLALVNGLTAAQEAKLDAIPTETLTTAQDNHLTSLANGLDAADVTYLDAHFAAVPTTSENANALLASVLEDGHSLADIQRVLLAAVAGILSGANTTNIKVRDQADTKDRIVAIVDQYGNRLSTVLDGT